MKTNMKFISDFSSLDESEYNKLLYANDAPFISYSFLKALENSGSVGNATGWQPNHLASFNKNKLSGFIPIYIKSNSNGEFVFDHSWSYALSRAGRNYYPKLISAIPFTPCETRKFITEESCKDFIEATSHYMHKNNIETWHILYPDSDLGKILKDNDFIERHGYKFIWKNKDYETFDDYLNIFKSRQRKNIKSFSQRF